MTSVFHQPVLGVHIVSHQNSVFIAFIDQQTNPAEARSKPVSERSSLQQHRKAAGLASETLLCCRAALQLMRLTCSYSEDAPSI